MSLQVWLPLNGDLQNLGLDDISTISTTNLSFSENGKIGACLNGYTGFFSIPSMIGKKQMSVAYWIRINTATATQWLDAFRWYSTDGTSTYSSRNEFYNNSTLTGFWFKGSSISGKSNTVGKWQHHIFTIDYNTGVAKFYINGILQGTNTNVDTTHYLTGTNFMIGENGLDTSHNDFRIYDHCLSPKEVKEISKGLIAHYPLNDEIGNKNLLIDSMKDYGFSHTTYGIADYNFSDSLVEGETYTIHIKINLSPEKKAFGVWHSGGGNIMGNMKYNVTSGVYSYSFVATSFMASQTSGAGHGYARVYVSNVNGTQGSNPISGTANVDWIKIEKGSVATPWIPNPADALYSELGLDDNIVYDCSGYSRNGVNTNTTTDGDAPRYSVSTKFNGTNYITLTNSSFPTVLSNDFTLSMWIHSDDDGDRSLWFGNYSISGGGNFFGFEKTTGDKVRFWWNAGNPDKYFDDASVTKSDGWVLLTLVKEGNVVKIYKNGVLSATNTSDLYASANLPSTATTFRLGADGRTTGSTLYKGSISDVRIYATALSAEDIKELYETSASIDNHGNMWAYEIQEV